jgi:hypothetical protein
MCADNEKSKQDHIIYTGNMKTLSKINLLYNASKSL